MGKEDRLSGGFMLAKTSSNVSKGGKVCVINGGLNKEGMYVENGGKL